MNFAAVGIITKPGSAEVRETGKELAAWFEARGIHVFFNQIEPDLDLLVILGGDGTLLQVAAKASMYDIPVVGINLGSLGFLTEIAAGEMHRALDAILGGAIHIERRMMLQASYFDKDGVEQGSAVLALNEVAIVKGSTDPVVRLFCWADKEYITTYKADGLLISTPTGSTAYNLSAGGPIVHAELESMLVTPICPFMLESRPVLLSSRSRITSQLAGPAIGVNVLVDGREWWVMEEGGCLVVQSAAKPLLLISSPHKGYFAILRNKLNWGGHNEEQPLPDIVPDV